jgi:hypothetical protein
MSIFKINIFNHPHFPNPVLLEIPNCDKDELINLLKQYMYSWLWIKPNEINQSENITELFYQKPETLPLQVAGYFWEVQEMPEEMIEEEHPELDILAENVANSEQTDQVFIGDETLFSSLEDESNLEFEGEEIESVEDLESVAESLVDNPPKLETTEQTGNLSKMQQIPNFNPKKKKRKK